MNKVMYPKYFKNRPYLLATTIDCSYLAYFDPKKCTLKENLSHLYVNQLFRVQFERTENLFLYMYHIVKSSNTHY